MGVWLDNSEITLFISELALSFEELGAELGRFIQGGCDDCRRCPQLGKLGKPNTRQSLAHW